MLSIKKNQLYLISILITFVFLNYFLVIGNFLLFDKEKLNYNPIDYNVHESNGDNGTDKIQTSYINSSTEMLSVFEEHNFNIFQLKNIFEKYKLTFLGFDRLNSIVYKMMAQNCGKADDYFMKIVDKKKHADWFLDAKQGKRHGLVNHIRVPKIDVSITVDIEFE